MFLCHGGCDGDDIVLAANNWQKCKKGTQVCAIICAALLTNLSKNFYFAIITATKTNQTRCLLTRFKKDKLTSLLSVPCVDFIDTGLVTSSR